VASALPGPIDHMENQCSSQFLPGQSGNPDGKRGVDQRFERN